MESKLTGSLAGASECRPDPDKHMECEVVWTLTTMGMQMAFSSSALLAPRNHRSS